MNFMVFENHFASNNPSVVVVISPSYPIPHDTSVRCGPLPSSNLAPPNQAPALREAEAQLDPPAGTKDLLPGAASLGRLGGWV